MRRLPWPILMIALAVPVLGQQARVVHAHHFEPKDGLSNRHVRALVQDHRGFIWVGTVSGLDRFDGHGFRNWSVSNGLSNNCVDELRLDGDDAIWVFATDASDDIFAIDILDARRGRLEPATEHFKAFPVAPTSIVRVGPRRLDGTIVLGTKAPARCIRYRRGGRFNVIDLPGERFEPLGDDRLGGIIGVLMAKDSSCSVVRVDTLGAHRVILQLDRGTHADALVSGRTSAGALYRLSTAGGQTRYFDTYSELMLTSTQASPRAVEHGDPIRRPLNFTSIPGSGLVMVDTRLIDDRDSVLFDLSARYAEIGGRVKDCLLDVQGRPWLATEFGLFRIEIRGDVFDRWLYEPNIPEGTGVLCRGMAVRGSTLYLSTEWDGAYRIDIDRGAAGIVHDTAFRYLLAMHVEPDGTWWRGGFGLVLRTDAAGQVHSYAVDDNIWSILPRHGGALLGGLKGIWSLDLGTGKVRAVSDPAYPDLSTAHVLQLQPEPDGSVLATTSKGLYRLDAGGRVERRWWSGAEPGMRLPYDDLHHCYRDADGVLWLSTRGAGLIRWEPITGTVQQFNTRNGFPNNMVYAAYEDGQGELWLPTDGGLVRFDKRSRQSTVFTSADGIAHDEFNRLAYAQSADGRLFFGGLNGITAVDPERFARGPDEAQDPLVFTGVMRYSPDQGDFVDHADQTLNGASLELDAAERSIKVSFALLSYEPQGRVVYAWRLTGVQDDWTYQTEPFVRLDRLPYGACVLEVKARDGAGQWSNAILQLPITVRKPWQEYHAAWAGIGALALALMLGGVRGLWRRPSGEDRPE